jgi:hypothetical protein
MAYIYKITNTINGKMYIGKTEQTIEKRFQQHCQDSQRDGFSNRPLYRAMQKYGVEFFSIEEIEETDNPEEREIYWIEFYGTFKNGYNATIGGDGKRYIDYDLVVATYQELKNATKTAEKLGISQDSVINILNNRKIYIYSSEEIAIRQFGKVTNMYSLDGKFLQSFPSTNAAAEYMVQNKLTGCKKTTIKQHITEVCTGRRKTAAKFKWKYAE